MQSSAQISAQMHPSVPPPAPAPAGRTPRKPGRPATYVFDKPEHVMSEKERKLKVAIEKRRSRQNRSYHRRKKVRNQVGADTSGTGSASSAPTTSASISLSAASVPTLRWSSQESNGSFSTAVAAPPRFVPGFAQNPLDLLATAGGSLGPMPSAAAAAAAAAASAAAGTVSPVHREEGKGAMSSGRVLPRSQLFRDAAMNDVLDVGTASVSDPALMTGMTSAMEADGTLRLDVTASSLDMGTFSFGLSKSKGDEEAEEEEATDALVNTALVAAKEYARDCSNLKDVMDREKEVRRMTGIKQIVFDNLRSKYLSMPTGMREALRHFIIFPRSFNLRAAASVAGMEQSQLVTMQGMIENMIQTNFIATSKGRYELNEAARLFLNEDETVISDNVTDRTYDVAQTRFIDHYRTQLSRLQDDDIHKVGWLREQAMALYDSERENMEFSEYLLTGKPKELREFLSAGITVMRYCVGAASRERILRKALTDDDTSTEDVSLTFANEDGGIGTLTSVSGRALGAGAMCGKSHRARLQLALSEAYFDQLKTSDAEEPLRQALTLMGNASPKCGASTSGVVDSVLVLLLLSNLQLGANMITKARQLCVKALKILAEAGLGRSTFGINAMSNLVSIYLEEGDLAKAKSVASKLLDTLNTMRYTGMPIYADALGVCAMVSMVEQNYREAERQYGTALETVGKWGSKEWTGIPVQHCLDLDLWLMEGLAESIRRQGRIDEATVLEQRALEDREIRGLPRSTSEPDYLKTGLEDSSRSPSGIDSLPKLRHLY